jgi:hypothetical protein
MTRTETQQITSTTFNFGDEVTFTNNWGQRNCLARVIWQDGDVLSIDYLGCQHEIALNQLT